MVERTGGASTVPCSILLVFLLSCVQEEMVFVLLLNLLMMSRVGMLALAWVPCYFSSRLLLIRMTMQSLHSLQGPPIARLSAPFSLPCAFAAFPSSPCFGLYSHVLHLLGSICAVKKALSALSLL